MESRDDEIDISTGPRANTHNSLVDQGMMKQLAEVCCTKSQHRINALVIPTIP